MEWKDILYYGLFAGLMLLMMKFGGCCGGHTHKKNSQEQGDSCCEKDADKNK